MNRENTKASIAVFFVFILIAMGLGNIAVMYEHKGIHAANLFYGLSAMAIVIGAIVMLYIYEKK